MRTLIALLLFSFPAFAWELLPEMPTPRSEIAVAHLEGKLYVAGGISWGTRNEFEAYDIEAGMWEELPPLPINLHHVALAAAQGKIWATGGYTSLTFTPNEPQLWAYDPIAKNWTRMKDMPAARGEHAMVAHDGKLLVISGRGENATQIWEYDPAADTWSTDRTPMPTYRHSAAVMLVHGKVYVAGGRNDDYAVMADVEVYDIAKDEWQRLPSLPRPLGGHGGAVLNGKLHVFGGELLEEAIVFHDHDVLDLASGTWRKGQPLAEARHGIAYITVNGTTYVIGGGAKAGWRTLFTATGTLQALALE